MLRYAKPWMLMVVGLVVLTVGLEANDDDDDRAELRMLRYAKPWMLMVIENVPVPVLAPPDAQVGGHPIQEVTVEVPDDFCDDPGSVLLTVMRPRMKWRRRWLRHSRKDLGIADVAFVGAAGFRPGSVLLTVMRPGGPTGPIADVAFVGPREASESQTGPQGVTGPGRRVPLGHRATPDPLG